ncbi:MAG: SdrD B-like domain-containing protein [Microgenomates group bacterium]
MRLIFKLSVKRIKTLQKFFSLLTVISLIFQFNYGFLFYRPILAEEPASSVQEIDQTARVETPEEVPPSTTETVVDNSSTQEASPTPETSPKEGTSMESSGGVILNETIPTGALPTEKPAVEDLKEPTAEVKQDLTSQDVKEQPEKGELTALILDNVSTESVNSLDLDVQNIAQSAQLATDKADYAPTDTVLISGSGFSPNGTYALIISSDDQPAVYFETQITTDENGGFVYAYQLDGNYRPNYKVEVKDKEGNLITKTVFTDKVSNFPYDCSYQCSANDVTIKSVELTKDILGTPLSCNPGEVTTAYIKITYDNHSTTRYAVYLIGDIYEGGVYKQSINWSSTCLDFINTGLGSKIISTGYTWSCGTSLAIKNIKVSWDTNTNNCASFGSNEKCNPPGQSWCNFGLDYIVTTPLIANFSANPLTICKGDTVQFTDLTTGGNSPYSYNWNFGDGGSSTLKNPTHQYNTIGTFDVSLTVTDSSGNSDTEKKLNYITVENCGYCGDGNLDQDLGEQCDYGDKNGIVCTPPYGTGGQPASCTYCSDNCQIITLTDGYCGDGKKDIGYEECDGTDGVPSGYTCSQNCTLIRDKGTIAIDKVTNPPGDTTEFIFNISSSETGVNEDISLKDQDVPFSKAYETGVYIIEEKNLPTGWDLTNLVCNQPVFIDLNKRTVTFELDKNENIACTFTNTKQGKIKIVKNAFGGDETFNFQIKNSQDITVATPSATTSGGVGDTGFINLPPDTYKIKEMFLEGWYSPESTNPPYCLDKNQNPVGSFNSKTHQITLPLNSNDEVTCYFQNIKYGKLIIDKTTNPSGDSQTFDFEFYRGGNYVKTVEDLTDQNTPYEIKTIFADVWQIVEKEVSGWKLTDITCVDPDNQTTYDLPNNQVFIDIDPGETVSCTFTNSKYGSILVHKFNDNNGNGVKDSGDLAIPGWEMKLFSGSNCQGNPIDQGLTNSSGNKLFSNLLAGQYSVLEVITKWPDGRDWINTTGGICQNVNLNAGQQVNVVFGNYLEGYIEICKVNDLNGNGSYGGEPFIPGWTMYLQTPTGQVLSGVTGDNGCYTFGDLAPGNYLLSEEERVGWIRTSHTRPGWYPISVPMVSGSGFSLKILNFQLGKISGQKFEDLDGDGIKDDNEPGLSGWIIKLDKGADGVVDNITTTDLNGNYEFSGLTAGIYRILEEQEVGWIQTSANPPDITIQSGTVVENVNFGNFQLGKISGRKYEDLNQDGGRDANEPYLNGWTIRLYDNGWNILGEKTTGHTGNVGQYRFENLSLGTYRVCEVLQAGWKQTGPVGNPNNYSPNKNKEGPRCRIVSITRSGQSRTGESFGNIRYGGILVHKFEDVNGNGVIDGQETGLENWEIKLFSGFDCLEEASISSGLTDSKGDLEFNNLVPGNYSVKEILKPGWQTTTSVCQNVSVVPGEITAVNIANFKLGEIKVCKYDDLNGDGVKDENEPGIAGVNIKLQKQSSEEITNWEDVGDWVETDETGCYLFDNLGPGTYRAVEDLIDTDLAGYTPTDSYLNEDSHRVSGGLTIASGASLTVNFLNKLQPVILGISKTNDTSGSIGPGTTVNYKITVTNTAPNTAYGVKVVDVLPYGFSYVVGSGKVGGVSVEPSISGQVLTWTIGNLAGNTSIEITYQVKTDSGLETGSFENQAYAYGYNRPTGGIRTESNIATSLVKIGTGTTYSATVSPIFGGTVLGAATEGQVLGAATGSPTSHLILALLMIITGLIIRNWEKTRKFIKFGKIIKVLILGLGILFTVTQNAQTAVKVSITDLPERINKYEFKVYYTVLDISETPSYNVQGWMRKEGEGWKQFDITKNEPSGYFQTKSEYFSGEGKYYFKVIGNGVESNIEEVIIDFSSPDAPRDYRKERLSSTEYKLYWRNPSNSDFEKVLVYRSEVRNFTADSSTLVGQRGGSPDQEMDFVDCCLIPNKEYYYALRAIDKAGNASSLVGDGGSTYYIEVTPTPSETSKVEEVKILPKEEKKGEILGEEATSPGEEKASLEEKTTEESIINKVTKNKKILLLGGGIILIILGGTFFLLSRRRSS